MILFCWQDLLLRLPGFTLLILLPFLPVCACPWTGLPCEHPFLFLDLGSSPIFFVWITVMTSYPLMVQQPPPPRLSPMSLPWSKHKVKNSSLCLQEVAVSGPCCILPASFQSFWLIMFHPYFKVFAGVRLSSNSRPFPIISTPFSTKSEISSSWTTTYSLQDELQPSVTLASSQLSLSSWYNDS